MQQNVASRVPTGHETVWSHHTCAALGEGGRITRK